MSFINIRNNMGPKIEVLVALGATRQAYGFFWPKALAAAREPGLLVCPF